MFLSRPFSAAKIPGQYLFVRTASPLLVELHTERTMRYFPRGLPLEDFLSRRQDVARRRTQNSRAFQRRRVAPDLHPRRQTLVGAFDSGRRRSRLDRSPDRISTGTSTFRSSRNIGADRMLHTGLLLAHDLLRAPLPQNIQARIQADTAGRAPRRPRSPPGCLQQVMPLPGLLSPRSLSRAHARKRLIRIGIPAQANLLPHAGRLERSRWRKTRRPSRKFEKARAPGKKIRRVAKRSRK